MELRINLEINMKNFPLVLSCLTFCLALGLSPIRLVADQVLFDNNTVVDFSFNSDAGSNSQILADNFSLASDSIVSQISWTGVYGRFVDDDSFTIDLFADEARLPEVGSLVTLSLQSVQRELTGDIIDIGGIDFELFSYTANVDDQFLAGGTDYWISILNETQNAFWSWGAETATGDFAFRNDPGDIWEGFPGSLDFQISGTAIPEPNSVLLVGLVLLGCSATRRRR